MEKPEILYKFFPIKTVEDAYLLTNAIVGYSDKNNIKFLDYIELDKLTAPFYQQNNCVIMANGRSVDDALEHPLIRFFKLRFGIIPLFANCSNFYVWNRYAGGYDSLFYRGEFNGMCIGFKTNGVFKEARKVEYVDKPKVIDITEKFNKFKDYFKKDNISYEDEEYKELFNALKDEVKESFFYKSKYWRHEQEYRIVEEFPYLNEQEEFELIEEIINADFGEIASVDKCYKKANNDILFENSHFFMYSHEEIACLITGCNLYEKFKKIINKTLQHFKNDYFDLFESNINISKMIYDDKKIFKEKNEGPIKLIKNCNKTIKDTLLKFRENINEYSKIAKDILQIITNEYDKKSEEYNRSYGIFMAFLNRPSRTLLMNLTPEARGIGLFYLFQTKLERKLTEIFGEKNIKNFKKNIFLKLKKKDAVITYFYRLILGDIYYGVYDFIEKKSIIPKDIENYKNSPEKLEKDMKDFYKNHPKKTKNIRKLSKNISKSIKRISKFKPERYSPFIWFFYIQEQFNFLDHFFKNQLEELKEQNEEFYEKLKKIDFKYLEEVKDNDRFYELH